MGMRYLFTSEELSFIRDLSRRIPGVFLSDTEMRAAEGLMKNHYIHMDGKIMVLEPFIMFLSDVLNNYEHKLELADGILFKGQVIIWVEEDTRKLHGKILSIFPSLEVWYQDQSEEHEMEFSLEECRRRLRES